MSTAVKEEIMQDSKLRMMLLTVVVILAVCLAAGCGRGKEEEWNVLFLRRMEAHGRMLLWKILRDTCRQN